MEAVEKGGKSQELKNINQPSWRLRTSLDFAVCPTNHVPLREQFSGEADSKDRSKQAVVDFPSVGFHGHLLRISQW